MVGGALASVQSEGVCFVHKLYLGLAFISWPFFRGGRLEGFHCKKARC